MAFYFGVPVLPKKMDLEGKKDLLVLPDMQTNIFHELVRRKRWNLLHRGFQKKADFMFQKDVSGSSPYETMLEKASFEIIMNFNVSFGGEEGGEIGE